MDSLVMGEPSVGECDDPRFREYWRSCWTARRATHRSERTGAPLAGQLAQMAWATMKSQSARVQSFSAAYAWVVPLVE